MTWTEKVLQSFIHLLSYSYWVECFKNALSPHSDNFQIISASTMMTGKNIYVRLEGTNRKIAACLCEQKTKFISKKCFILTHPQEVVTDWLGQKRIFHRYLRQSVTNLQSVWRKIVKKFDRLKLNVTFFHWSYVTYWSSKINFIENFFNEITLISNLWWFCVEIFSLTNPATNYLINHKKLETLTGIKLKWWKPHIKQRAAENYSWVMLPC